MHHTETTLKSTFQRSGTPAERYHSREREKRRRKREEIRALTHRGDRSRDDSGGRNSNTSGRMTENRLVLRRRTSHVGSDDEEEDGRTRCSATSRGTMRSRARSVSGGGARDPRGSEPPHRMQGDLTQRRRIGCLGSSTDRTFRPEGSGKLGPPKVIRATTEDEEDLRASGDRSRSRGREPERSAGRHSTESRVKSGRSQSRGKSVSRKSIAEGRGRDPSQSRSMSRSRPRSATSVAGTTKSSRSQSRGPSASESKSRRSADEPNVKRSQSRGRLVSRSGTRSQSRGRRGEESFAASSKSKSSRAQSRDRRGEDQTVATNRTSKSKSSRSQSRDRRTEEECTVKSKSSRSQSRDGRRGEECTVKSSKSRDHRKSSSATVASASSGWRSIKQSIIDHNGFSNLTHYSGSSGKYSGGTEETSPMSYYSGAKEPQESDREKRNGRKKKNKTFSPAMPPAISPNVVGIAAGDVHKSTTYSPDAETIVTNLYDRTGHCVRHPHVRLRKKKLWGGGWNILIANCPDCCLEEMGRLVRKSKEKESASASASGGKHDEKDKKKKSVVGVTRVKDRRSSESVYPSTSHEFHDTKSVRSNKSSRRAESSPLPPFDKNCENNDSVPIFEFDIPLEDQPGHHCETYTSPRSVKSRKSIKSSVSKKSVQSSKTTKTNKSCKTSKSAQTTGSGGTERSGKSMRTTKTAKSSSKSVKSTKSSKSTRTSDIRRQRSEPSDNIAPPPSSSAPRTTAAVRVAKMPYTDHFGCHGKYSGEVNSFGQPNGKGVLRYDDGRVSEGPWVDGRCEQDDRDCGRSVSNRSVANKSVSNRSVSNKSVSNRSVSNRSVSNRSVSNRSLSRSPGRNSQQHPQQKGYITNMPWSDVNGFSGHYTGEINANNAPEGRGYMQYSNGVIEDGMWCNGVFQPPLNLPPPPPCRNQDVPSSSMSVWSLRSAPNMTNNNYNIGGHGGGGRAGSVYGMRY